MRMNKGILVSFASMDVETVESQAIDTIYHAASLCGGFDKMAVSFNGGKDCTVLLDLFLRAARKFNHQGRLKVAYVKTSHPFPELEDFINDTATRYIDELELYVYPTQPLKEGFKLFIAETNVTGVLVGIRSSDPYGAQLTEIMKTDNGWPEFTRVHPLLNWSYRDIWDYIQKYKLKYCSLYDNGYTSLGDSNNTVPNERLRRPDGTFKPAYELDDPSLERDCRSKS